MGPLEIYYAYENPGLQLRAVLQRSPQGRSSYPRCGEASLIAVSRGRRYFASAHSAGDVSLFRVRGWQPTRAAKGGVVVALPLLLLADFTVTHVTVPRGQPPAVAPHIGSPSRSAYVTSAAVVVVAPGGAVPILGPHRRRLFRRLRPFVGFASFSWAARYRLDGRGSMPRRVQQTSQSACWSTWRYATVSYGPWPHSAQRVGWRRIVSQ